MPMKMTMFLKYLKKCSCVRYLVGVCRDSWVLASNARDVKETCDSLFSVHSFLTKALRIPYN